MKEDWIVTSLGRLASKITKGSTPTTYGYKFQKSGINFIKIENVKNGVILQDSIVNFISEEAHNSQERSKLQEGDILFSIAGTIGEACLVKSNILPANTNQAFAIINGFNDILLPEFLIKQLESFVAIKIKSKARGGAMNNVSLGDLKELSVIVSPLPIQRAIVSKIESLFSDLDNGIADLKKAQEQLKIYRQALLKKAFEGELTKEWREQQTNQPTADELLEQIKQERQKHYEQQLEDWKQAVKTWEENGKEGKKPSKPTKLKNELLINDSNQPAIPLTWQYINIEFATYKLGDGLHGTPNYSDDGEYYFINGNNLNGKQIKIKSNTKKVDQVEYLKHKRELNNDTVLVSINGTIGNTSFYNDEKVILGKSACYFNLLSPFDKNYVRWRIDSLGFINYATQNATGSTIKNVPLKAMREYLFPLCTIEEQHQIVREIESRLSVCDKVEQNISEALNKSEALRQSILKKAFEGKLLSEAEIEKCKQEADYEPASVLLARIEQSRNEKIKKEKKD